MKNEKRQERRSSKKEDKQSRRKLSIEQLEERIAPSAPPEKKIPVPPAYPPGADYGLARRDNLFW